MKRDELAEICLQLLEESRGHVLIGIGQETPAEGLTLISDLRNLLAQQLAIACGAQQDQVESLLQLASEQNRVPWNVSWIGFADAINLFATQGEQMAAVAERAFARAKAEGLHLAAFFLAGDDIVPFMFMDADARPVQ